MVIWRQDQVSPVPVAMVGTYRDRQVPEALYGILGALLTRSADMGEDLAQVLARDGLPLPERPCRVLLLALDDPRLRDLGSLERHGTRLHLYHTLRDHMAQALSPETDGFLFLMSGALLGLLYPREGSGLLEQCCRETIPWARDSLDVSCHVQLSTPWDSPLHIQRAYRMVLDLEDSRSFYGGMMERVYLGRAQDMERLTDKAEQTKFEQTFFTTADRICGTVRAGDRDAAAQELRRQMLAIAENCVGLPYPSALNLTVNRFFSLLQYRLMEEELGDWRYLQSLDFSRDLISAPALSAFLEVCDQIAARLVAHARDRMESRHAALMREIRAYVEENSTDVNMGLTAVARRFHISPRDVAETFRQFYGISINDVIHRARVKRAKELLLTTSDSVQSIAGAVGYCSLATMYRAFTNIEGVAPGKLRQSRDRQK